MSLILSSGRCFRCGQELGTSSRCLRCDQDWSYGNGGIHFEGRTDKCSGCSDLEKKVRELEETIDELKDNISRVRRGVFGHG